MSMRVTGTIVGGVLKFDDPVNLPDQSRVSVTVEPLADVEQRLAAWNSIKERLRLRPINSGGRRFTRDELHERD
ncbi:MAG TPA: hypothetical protein VK137_02230 [Planctomycetaceae bacterium]|nr:hypothetical protein [Planctomycetaceae bacterium]